MKTLFRLAALAASLASGSAHAQFLAGLTPKDCADGRVSNDALRDLALAQAKLPLSTAVARLLVANTLGTRAEQAVDCTSNCSALDKQLVGFYVQLGALSSDSPPVASGFAVRIGANAPKPEKRVGAFLNGDWDWLQVTCAAAPPVAGNSAGPRPAKPGKSPAGGGVGLVIGKDESDLGKGFDKRGFATIGYSNDFEAKKTTWTIDAYLALTGEALGKDHPVEFQPFASFQYNSGKKIDDLAFGGALILRPDGGGNLIDAKVAWETDHRFDSSLWRGDIGFTPVAPAQICERGNKLDTRYFVCGITLVGDFEHVSAVGGKTSLATLENFGRLGADASFTWGQRVSPDFGYLTLTASYSFREQLSGNAADAGLFAASIGVLPAKKGPWKFSLDYSRGRDLTSLVRQNKLMLSIGFRQ